MSEFANVDEAVRLIIERAYSCGYDPVGIPVEGDDPQIDAAREWLRAAVAYAQVRGFGHAPRVTLEQMLTNDANKSPDPLDTETQLNYTNQESDDDARGR